MSKHPKRVERPKALAPRRHKRALRLQYGALPYRFGEDGGLQILLVTTRRSGRWIIPKGGPIRGLSRSASAAQEAYEEAGIRGTINNRSLGSFMFLKTSGDSDALIPCEVFVFPLLVKRQMKSWPEQDQRICEWFEPEDAVANLQDDGLAAIVAAFSDRLALKRQYRQKPPK